ncbi:MAG: DUF3379 family protein [Proteobacteria bacterium]|nr:DUF3379 family protein [Pseudomonadota bacterium]
MTMNCEEYKQTIAEDPNFDGGAGHVSECTECRTYRDEMRALDVKIGRALALEVPDLVLPDLPDLENVVSLSNRRRLSTPTWFAMAATVLLAVFFSVRFAGDDSVDYDSLADEVLAHVSHEPSALRVTDVAVSDARLLEAVPANIAELDESAGLITFAESCLINGHNVPHLVIQGQRGPITIILMPDEKIPSAIALNDGSQHGVILPVGDGSIAIVAGLDEPLDEVQKQVLQSVVWST